MPKKLNDTQVLEIVTKHANGTSISALAREYKLLRNTVKSYSRVIFLSLICEKTKYRRKHPQFEGVF